MNTELPEPVDSSTSEHVSSAELRMQQALADICNGVGWSNDKQLARHYGVTRKTIGTGARRPYQAQEAHTKAYPLVEYGNSAARPENQKPRVQAVHGGATSKFRARINKP